MWEAELSGDNNVSDFDVYLRKSLDDAEMLHQADGENRLSWPRLLIFLAAVAVFLIVALLFVPGS
jgi:hypothetical protein